MCPVFARNRPGQNYDTVVIRRHQKMGRVGGGEFTSPSYPLSEFREGELDGSVVGFWIQNIERKEVKRIGTGSFYWLPSPLRSEGLGMR